MPGTVLGAGDVVVNKTKTLSLRSLCFGLNSDLNPDLSPSNLELLTLT